LIVTTSMLLVARPNPHGRADAAIILGAAVWGSRPSPVFEERIKYGLILYRSGKVRRLILTGGYGEGSRHAESEVAAAYLEARGVPRSAMLIEVRSRTTLQNLEEAKRLMGSEGLRSALIVSDPLHMRRALSQAHGLDISAEPSPTLTSRYRSLSTKAQFLLRELYFLHHYWIFGR
jgi:uncharacterized SAM-binding protein YcdF (DUF218 family)